MTHSVRYSYTENLPFRFTLNRVSVLSHCCVLLIQCLRWKRTKNARYALLSKVNRQMYTCANQIQQHYITNKRVHTYTIAVTQYSYIYIHTLYMLKATRAHIHINTRTEADERKLRRTWAEQFKETSDTNHDSFNPYTILYYTIRCHTMRSTYWNSNTVPINRWT